MRTVLATLAVFVWFALNGLLWSLRPPDLLWLLGSAVLGGVFFLGFWWYLAAQDDQLTKP